jgi:DNA-binding NarL/FixJ family response regulator
VDGEAQLTPDGRRQFIADYLKAVGARVNPQKPASPARGPAEAPAGAQPKPQLELRLSPRLQQTLARLLAGDSEKQVARHLALSKNTVHVYVKALYRHYNVNSRAELLAKFVSGGGV